MENALLVGLSRQMALGRELDVVANNIANINTTGFKADSSLFEEYPDAGRARRRFAGNDRRVSFVQRPRHLASTCARAPIAAHRQSARRRHRRQRLLRRCRRRAASATPATARCRSTPPASSSPATAIRCSATAGPITFQTTDHDVTISPTARSACAKATARPIAQRGKLQLVAFANPQQLQKDGASTFRAPAGVQPAAGAPTPRVVQGAIEKSNVRARRRNDAHDRDHPQPTPRSPACCSSRATSAATRIAAARRRPGLMRVRSISHACASTPQRPA